jgi:AraC-like DNA-binding protein
MNKKPVSCASVADQTGKPFFVYHQKLGRFYSDWHRHEWGQLVYAENGCIHLNVSGKKVLLPGWYGAWIPPGTFHEIWSDSADLLVRAICFTVEASNDSLHQLAVFPASPLLKEMIRYSEKWNRVSGEDRQEQVFLQALQDVLPGEIARSVGVCLPSTSHEKLARLLEYLQSHLHEKISIDPLARHFGFSVRTLARLFNGQLGISFSGYCKIARIMRALELIEAGGDNVSQIAGAVGYESLATFSNNFLAICGNRPLHFINQKRTRP